VHTGKFKKTLKESNKNNFLTSQVQDFYTCGRIHEFQLWVVNKLLMY
jgi:hypothetical protein